MIALMTERWLPVPRFEPYYEVSDLGGVRRSSAAKGTWPGRMLRHKIDRKGYHRVTFTVNDTQRVCAVHRLVAWADFDFIHARLSRGRHQLRAAA